MHQEYGGAVVPVLQGHLLLEDARHSHRARWSRKDLQIDESVMVQAKYHRGHQLRARQRWVFGVYDPEKKEGHIELVENREAAMLIPIIQRVMSGTTIWSDEWAAYRTLSQLGYTHQTVNHSRNFKDSVTGVCTNHVEAYWCRRR